jgi:hypothetical protein
VSRVGLGFSSNPKFRFSKSKVQPSFHYFWGLNFDGHLRSCLLGVLVRIFLSGGGLGT